jgi:hypothetical protein
MAKQTDWYPSKRQDQLDMVSKWFTVFNETKKDDTGASVKKAVLWGIPAETVTALGGAFAEAQEALTESKKEETRTAVTNTRISVAFPAWKNSPAT